MINGSNRRDGATAADVRKQRVAQGLCPECGKEAAPYRLCDRCHMRAQIRRFMKSLQKQGAIEIVADPSDGRKKVFRAASPDINPGDYSYGGLGLGRRGRPRLGRIPVDVEKELLRLAASFSKPFTIEEIVAAWGRLREKRKRGSLVGDMTAIIAAQRKREARMMKRAQLGGSVE